MQARDGVIGFLRRRFPNYDGLEAFVDREMWLANGAWLRFDVLIAKLYREMKKDSEKAVNKREQLPDTVLDETPARGTTTVKLTFKALAPREAELLTSVFINGKSLARIAREQKRSVSVIWNQVQRIFAKLRANGVEWVISNLTEDVQC